MASNKFKDMNNDWSYKENVSLRDKFAFGAMQVIMQDVGVILKDKSMLADLLDSWVETYGKDVTIREGIAKDSYKMADEMLEARKWNG